MLNKISQFFEQFIQFDAAKPEDESHRLNLAVAALLIEMSLIDNEISHDEQAALRQILVEHYELTNSELDTVMQLANQELNQATDYYQFTSLINQHFSLDNKIKMISQLWKVAISDGKIDHHEEHYVRKIADLLFVPHSEFIKTKLQVTSDS
ncbi:TerB family tellurite resistance protein [Aliikangiella maris]|uniref:TerB family tellurite resistance protein n=2 Tax=Aliikangiella maris TaxID=3162458 RepID=A0ABV2BV11_9GAMM